MAMSRKHYEAIAADIKRRFKLIPDPDGRDQELAGQLFGVANDLADLFEADNPNFDRGRFLKACGV
jgi:hypothetical protein